MLSLNDSYFLWSSGRGLLEKNRLSGKVPTKALVVEPMPIYFRFSRLVITEQHVHRFVSYVFNFQNLNTIKFV